MRFSVPGTVTTSRPRRSLNQAVQCSKSGHDDPPRPSFAPPLALRCAPMSITVVGSIAYDTVRTPFGERERMLGGAAVHFALAASFFEDVCVVGPVGEDFGEPQLEVMRRRGVDVSGIEQVPGGRDLLLAGRVRLGPEHARDDRHPAGRLRGISAEALAGRPGQRRAVPGEHPAGPAARGAFAAPPRPLRGAGLDEPVDRHRPRLAGGGDRGRRLRDPQRRRAAPADRQAEPRHGGPGDPLLGPRPLRAGPRPERRSSPSRASTARRW